MRDAPINPTSAPAADGRWSPGPPRPRLQPGEVHLWRADLDAVARELGSLLDERERERAARILGTRQRRRWTAGRGLLRTLLGAYLDTEPAALHLAAGARGKPLLRGRAELPFNLSHSGASALYAFSACGPVGVDVELAGRAREVASLAGRAFGDAAARRLSELGRRAREHEFLAAWTRHEAALKCVGEGLGGAPAAGPVHAPDVLTLDLGPRAAGALATLAKPTAVRCWEWPSHEAPARSPDGRAAVGRGARRS